MTIIGRLMLLLAVCACSVPTEPERLFTKFPECALGWWPAIYCDGTCTPLCVSSFEWPL